MDEQKKTQGLKRFWVLLTGRALPPDRRWWVVQNLWAFLLLTGSAYCIGLLSLYFGAGEFKLEMFQSYFHIPHLPLLNLGPVLLMALLWWLLTARVWAAVLLTGGITMGFTIVNALKIALRSTPLLWEDLALVTEAAKISGNYALNITRGQLAAIVLCVLAVAACALLTRRKVRGRPLRLGGGAAVLALMLVLFQTVYQDTGLYNATENLSLINRWSDTQQYQSRGFVYPFLHSSADAKDDPPDGYDREKAAAVLAGYEDQDIPEEQKVNVLAIMLEAYSDLTSFPALAGLDSVEQVYSYWHTLAREGYSGRLVTNVFAGGTVTTERAFLTGFSQLGSFRSPTNSYARYFLSQGYRVTGSHPNNDWFYNRLNVNENLGFSDYLYYENYYQELLPDLEATQRNSDGVLFPELLKQLDGGDKPCFSFSVTFQNHGPYASEQTNGTEWIPASTGWSDSTRNVLNNYLDGLERTNQALEALVDELRNREEPVVLVLFGDHKPWLGDNNSVYTELGVNLDRDTQEGFYNYYSTTYIFWANDAAKAALGRDFSGTGPDLSPCFLMNELFAQCGWEGPAFLQLADTVKETVPVVHSSGLYLEDGVLTDSLTPSRQALVDTYHQVQYYWRKDAAPVGQ